MKTSSLALVAVVSSAAAFSPTPSFVGHRRSSIAMQMKMPSFLDFLSPKKEMTKAEEAIAEAKAASEKYGASSPEAALAWEGKICNVHQNFRPCWGSHPTFSPFIRQPSRKLTARTTPPLMLKTERR